MGKWLFIGSLGLLYAVGSIAFVLGIIRIKDSTDSEPPLAYTGVFSLESTEVTNQLVILGEQCNNTDGPLSAVGTASLIRLDVTPNLLVPLFANASRPLDPGCLNTRAEFPLPPTIKPGAYTFQLIVQQIGGPPQADIIVTIRNVRVME